LSPQLGNLQSFTFGALEVPESRGVLVRRMVG
jgi:hypothetical protein